MKASQSLPQEKKLTVLFRVEPGCLGPDGAEHIEPFCKLAQKVVDTLDREFIHWDIVPRYDKQLPEMEYKINHQKLSYDKAAKYLEIFGKNLDDFEEHLHNTLTTVINRYLKR